MIFWSYTLGTGLKRYEISSNALETLHKQKFNAPKQIPQAEDIKTLNTFLKSETESAVEDLEKYPRPTTWHNLAELTLAQVVLFNRRRGGEAQRIEIAGYTQGLAHGKTTQSEVLESLDKFNSTWPRLLKEKRLGENKNYWPIRDVS